jgi:hypothetical protein
MMMMKKMLPTQILVWMKHWTWIRCLQQVQSLQNQTLLLPSLVTNVLHTQAQDPLHHQLLLLLLRIQLPQEKHCCCCCCYYYYYFRCCRRRRWGEESPKMMTLPRGLVCEEHDWMIRALDRASGATWIDEWSVPSPGGGWGPRASGKTGGLLTANG